MMKSSNDAFLRTYPRR